MPMMAPAFDEAAREGGEAAQRHAVARLDSADVLDALVHRQVLLERLGDGEAVVQGQHEIHRDCRREGVQEIVRDVGPEQAPNAAVLFVVGMMA
jgi:hypothetical protein